MCLFFITAVIIDAWLLGLDTENIASVHNCPGLKVFLAMNAEEDQAVKLLAKIGDDLLS